jgi:hypothetical protein
MEKSFGYLHTQLILVTNTGSTKISGYLSSKTFAAVVDN